MLVGGKPSNKVSPSPSATPDPTGWLDSLGLGLEPPRSRGRLGGVRVLGSTFRPREFCSTHQRGNTVLWHAGLDNTSPIVLAVFLCSEHLGPRAGNIHGLNITWIWREGRGDDPEDPTPSLQLSCQGCCQCILCPLALTLPLKSYRSPLPCQQTPSDEQHVCCTLHVCEAQRVSNTYWGSY